MTTERSILLLDAFASPDNKECLLKRAKSISNDPRVHVYLRKSLQNHINNFREVATREHMYTEYAHDMYRGTEDYGSDLECMNALFLTQLGRFIRRDLLRIPVERTMARGYTQSDGHTETGPRMTTRRVLCDKDTGPIDDPMLAYKQKMNGMEGQQQWAHIREPHFQDKTWWETTRLPRESDEANKKLESWWYPSSTVRMAGRDDPAGERNDVAKGKCSGADYGTVRAETFIDYHDEADDAVNRYDPLNTILSTPYVQALNQQRGDKPRPDPTSSTWDRGKYGPKLLPVDQRQGIDLHPKTEAYVNKRGFKLDNSKPEPNEAGYEQYTVAAQYAGNVHCDSPNDTPDWGFVNEPQNNIRLFHDGDGFMDQNNNCEMKHYLERRTFRSHNYSDGIPHGDSAKDQIPHFRKYLHSRHYERDVDEAVGGFETDCHVRGYGKDMQSLYCRVPNKITCGRTLGNRATRINNVSGERPSNKSELTYNYNSYEPGWNYWRH